MVSSRGVSALACAAVGLTCIVHGLGGHGRGDAAAVAMAIPPAPPPAAEPPPTRLPQSVPPAHEPAAAATAAVDTSLATGSIPPGPALHVPNPAAYAEAKTGAPPTVTGLEAINYLAGNTLRREGPGEPLHFTHFSSRGVVADGDEHSFTARRWQRETPELCETGSAGETLCRSVTIVLDGKYEYPGARLGTVTLGAAGGSGPTTAELVKGDSLHVPDHIPLLDSDVATEDPAATVSRAPAKSGDALDVLVGQAAGLVPDEDGKARQIVFYARDNRRLELQPIQSGNGRAVQVTVGHWRSAKGILCQSRVTGEAAQTCFKVEPRAGRALHLAPVGKTGSSATLTALPETDVRQVAQD